MDAIVLAVSQENADALLDGKRSADHRALPPTRLTPLRRVIRQPGPVLGPPSPVLGEPT